MAFKAGAVVGEAILDDSKWTSGSKGIEKSNKGLTSSMLKAQVAFRGIEIVTKKVIDVGKRAVQNFAVQEQAEKSLTVALGKTSKTLLNQASALQEVTTYGDEAIISGQAFLAQMKLTETQIQQLTPAVLDFAKAKGIDLKTAFDLVSKSVGSSTNALSRYGIQIDGAAKSNERVENAVNALTTAFGGQATAARDTLGGAYEALQNVQGDLLEDFGSFISVIGKDFVNGMLQGTIAIRNFLAEEKNLKAIQDTFAAIGASVKVGFSVFKEIGSAIFQDLKTAIDDIVVSFNELFGDLNSNASVFDALGNYVKIFSINLGIAIKLIKTQIQLGIDWINVLKNIGQALIAVGQALANPLKWKEAKKQLAEVKDSFKSLTVNAVKNVDDIVKGVVKGFKELPDSAKENSSKFNKIWSDAYDKYKFKAEDTTNEILEGQEDALNQSTNHSKEWLANQKSIMKEWNSLQRSAVQNNIKEIEGRRDKFVEAGVNQVEANKWANKEIRKTWGQQATKTLGIVSSMASQVANIYSSLFSTIMSFQEQELEELKAKNEEQEAEIEAQNEALLEQEDENYEAKKEQLEAQREEGLISEAEYDAQMEILEAQHEDNTTKIKLDNEARLEAAKQKNRDKENAKAKKIFEANKANQIAMVWINAAIGIVSAFAMGISQLGPIAGAIIGAVMAALLVGVAVAQTVVISQQQYVPAKAEGGMASGTTRVNELGGEIITLPDGSQVIPNDISRQIANNTGNQKTINISANFRGAVISDQMSLQKISNYVSRDIARQVSLA